MSKPESFVKRLEDVKPEAWSDARGRLSFHTLVSADLTPSNGLVAGVSTVPPGGALATHAHAQPEIYFALEGQAVVTIAGVERVVSAGATVFIPGDALHSIANPFDQAFRIFYVFPADRFDEIKYKFASPLLIGEGGISRRGD
jgi:oxalate decarboxylase/phosphoglucose isomerase-like protein (cupin superfamily)